MAQQAEKADARPDQIHEMNLGISNFKFQYLHIMVLLTRQSPESDQECIETARQMISLLPGMVSNWNQVYNGIIW